MIKIDKKKLLLIIVLAIYIVSNFVLVLYHEPWRDEAHAWLMAEKLSIKELFIESKFDGHPILWHLILMPFAKSGFPIITANIISLIIMSVSAYLFLFKTKLNYIFKIAVIFTIPFMYTYTAIARNYCLIVLLLMLIGVLYKDRFKKPIIYSIIIALLVHTHSLAWGIVAGLTLTFHFFELTINFNKHSKGEIKNILLGLIIIIFSTLLVVFELYDKKNIGFQVYENDFTKLTIFIMCAIIFITFIISFFIEKKFKKEFFVLTLGYAFSIFIYVCVYSSILSQRFILIFVYLVFYYILIASYYDGDSNKSKMKYIYIVIYVCISIFGMINYGMCIFEAYIDIKYPYSSAKEMSEYINTNLKEEVILVDSSIISQTMEVYLKDTKLYDFIDDRYVGCADSILYNPSKTLDKVSKLNNYKGKYVIIANDLIELEYTKIYETKKSIQNEWFTLYYID